MKSKLLIGCFLWSLSLSANVDSLKMLLAKAEADSNRIDLLIALVNAYQNVDVAQAFPYARNAISLSEKIEDYSRLGSSHIALGRTHANLGIPDSAEFSFTHALEAFQTADDLQGIARVYNKFTFIEIYQTANYDQALEYAFKALEIYEKLGDERGMVATYNDIGTIFNAQKEPEESNAWAEKALKKAEENQWSDEVATALSTMAYNLFSLEQYVESYPYFDRIIELARAEGDLTNLAIAYNGKANAFKLNGDYGHALEMYEKGIEAAKKCNFKSLLPSLYFNIGQVHYFLENYPEALEGMQDGLDRAIALGQTNNLIENYEYLAKVHEALDNHEEALGFYKQHMTFRDSIFNAEKERIVNELNTRYQTAQKEKEIELLASRNAQQRAQNRLIVLAALGILLLAGFLFYRFRYVSRIKEALDASNAAKDRLFAIISHDLRGVVSGFQNVGQIIQFHLKKGNYERLEIVSNRIGQSANNLNTLLDNLLQWSLTQMDGVELDPQPLSIAEETSEIVALFQENAAAKGIELKTEITPGLQAYADVNSLKLVLRNLVSNALKFSSEGDQIEIMGHQTGGKVVLEVRDTGAGIPKEKLDKIFKIDKKTSSKGTAGEQGTGLGLALCKEFAERNHGSIRLESKVGEGTTCFFTLPLAS